MGVTHSMDDTQVVRISDALRNSADAIQGINAKFDVIDAHMNNLQQFNSKLNAKVEGTLAAMSRLDSTFNNRAEVMIETVFTMSDGLALELENVIGTLRNFDLRREASQLPKVVIPLAVPMLLLLVELAVANAYLGILVASLPEVRSKYSSYLLGNASAILLGLMLSLVWLACYRIWLSRRSRRPAKKRVFGGVAADDDELEGEEENSQERSQTSNLRRQTSLHSSGSSAASMASHGGSLPVDNAIRLPSGPMSDYSRRSRPVSRASPLAGLSSIPATELEAELHRRRINSASALATASERGLEALGDMSGCNSIATMDSCSVPLEPTRSQVPYPDQSQVQLSALMANRQARRREIHRLRAELGMPPQEGRDGLDSMQAFPHRQTSDPVSPSRARGTRSSSSREIPLGMDATSKNRSWRRQLFAEQQQQARLEVPLAIQRSLSPGDSGSNAARGPSSPHSIASGSMYVAFPQTAADDNRDATGSPPKSPPLKYKSRGGSASPAGASTSAPTNRVVFNIDTGGNESADSSKPRGSAPPALPSGVNRGPSPDVSAAVAAVSAAASPSSFSNSGQGSRDKASIVPQIAVAAPANELADSAPASDGRPRKRGGGGAQVKSYNPFAVDVVWGGQKR
mmetsp:Transcript_18774/g.43870  ORF Transcript_18774/g.43870 Transcript_18774/m.43870 type:complete len:631 (+) Transcript_18774:64-1956(+)